MQIKTYVLGAIVTASCLAMAVRAGISAKRTREGAGAVSTPSRIGGAAIAGHLESGAGAIPVRYDDGVVKWIPILVPLLAVTLALGAYIIGATVL